jgi:hypothetical protein
MSSGFLRPLPPSFSRFSVEPEKPVRGGLGAQIDAVVESPAPDLGHGQVGVLRFMEEVDDVLAFGL